MYLRSTQTYYSCLFFLDAVRFQGLGAILDWLTSRLDFMRELWIPLAKWRPAGWLASKYYFTRDRTHSTNPWLLLIHYLLEQLLLKVPLTPKYFLNRNKTLFGVDYFGEKISGKGLFLDFLWIFKVRKIEENGSSCGLWRRPGKHCLTLEEEI